MYKRSGITLWDILKFLVYALIIAVLSFAVIRLVVGPAPQQTGPLPAQDAQPTILDKLGPQTAVSVIVVMVGLLAWVFWLFISFGRRLSERGYLGPLASDALAHAEIARIEDNLREDLRRGVYASLIDIKNADFRKRYNISPMQEPPNLVPGITIDETGRVLRSEHEWDYEYETSPGDDYGYYGFGDYESVSTEEKQRRAEEEKKRFESEKRFREAYRDEQLRLYREHLFKERNAARDRARALLPDIDVSSFGGGWIFVLEFTTIIFIVFAALALGFVGVLGAEMIGTILASVAGYVLGKSSTIRTPGGQEIVRGGEQPTAVMDALVKQASFRVQTDEEKITLQKQVQELQNQLAKTKAVVPLVLGKTAADAESLLKEKGFVPEIKFIMNPEVQPEVVFDQSPAGGAEVDKSSIVVLFAARKPAQSNADASIVQPTAAAQGQNPAEAINPEVEGEEGFDAGDKPEADEDNESKPVT